MYTQNMQANNDEYQGDSESASQKKKVSYGLSCAGILFSFIIAGVVFALYFTVLRQNEQQRVVTF